MNTSPENIGFVVLLILIAVGAFFLYKSKQKKDYYKTRFTYSVEYPDNPRRDVHWGYYTTYQNQVEEVKDHVTLHWQNFWEGEDKAVEDIRKAVSNSMIVVLDVSTFLFTGKAIKADAEQALIAFFARLAEEGLLNCIAAITPIDEPNLPQTQVDHLIPAAVEIIRKAKAFFQEATSNMELAIIYYYMPPFNNIELFDIVGFDNYHTGSGILAPGQQYSEFKKLLKPHQKTMLLVGGSYNEDPEPFLNYALSNDEVWAVVVFLWANLPHSGIGNPLSVNEKSKQRYINIGLRAKELNS